MSHKVRQFFNVALSLLFIASSFLLLSRDCASSSLPPIPCEPLASGAPSSSSTPSSVYTMERNTLLLKGATAQEALDNAHSTLLNGLIPLTSSFPRSSPPPLTWKKFSLAWGLSVLQIVGGGRFGLDKKISSTSSSVAEATEEKEKRLILLTLLATVDIFIEKATSSLEPVSVEYAEELCTLMQRPSESATSELSNHRAVALLLIMGLRELKSMTKEEEIFGLIPLSYRVYKTIQGWVTTSQNLPFLYIFDRLKILSETNVVNIFVQYPLLTLNLAQIHTRIDDWKRLFARQQIRPIRSAPSSSAQPNSGSHERTAPGMPEEPAAEESRDIVSGPLCLSVPEGVGRSENPVPTARASSSAEAS